MEEIMTISNIISAIGNNSSVYPLIVRDCGIEVPVKIAMTYNQNKKESKGVAYLAARERFLDEYATSAVWLGGIPLIGKLCDYVIKKEGFAPDVNLKLFQSDKFQGVNYNIKKFKNLAPDAVSDLINVKNNKKLYEKFLAFKFIASTSIPILFMGFILPKLVFASSAKKIDEMRKKNYKQINFLQKDKFFKPSQVSFKGSWVTTAANFTTQNKMAVTDGGYAIGRVSTARNKNESIDLAFKMSGMMFLNFVAPKWIEKVLNKITGAQLDPVMLSDSEFVRQVKDGNLKLPKSSNPKDLFNFIDNISNKDTKFMKYAKKFEIISVLSSGIRDPRAYVDVKKLGKFRNDVEQFMKKSRELNPENFAKYINRAKVLKTANILTNIGLSSFLLAYALPKSQFIFRKFVTGSDLEPGLAPAEKLVNAD